MPVGSSVEALALPSSSSINNTNKTQTNKDNAKEGVLLPPAVTAPAPNDSTTYIASRVTATSLTSHFEDREKEKERVQAVEGGEKIDRNLNAIAEEFSYLYPEEEASLSERLARSGVTDMHKPGITNKGGQSAITTGPLSINMTTTRNTTTNKTSSSTRVDAPYTDDERRRADKFGANRDTYTTPSGEVYLRSLGRPEDKDVTMDNNVVEREKDNRSVSQEMVSMSMNNALQTVSAMHMTSDTINTMNTNNTMMTHQTFASHATIEENGGVYIDKDVDTGSEVSLSVVPTSINSANDSQHQTRGTHRDEMSDAEVFAQAEARHRMMKAQAQVVAQEEREEKDSAMAMIRSNVTQTQTQTQPVSKEQLAMQKTAEMVSLTDELKGAFVDGMTLPQINDYLSIHGFLHVTPRYNVEKVKHHNFYDLVVLEIPGNNLTGLVWRRKFGNGGAIDNNTFTLAPHQVIQLSLDGALIMGDRDINTGERASEILSLEDLVVEREISESCRRLKYFKFYREARVFFELKRYVRAQRMERVTTRLQRESIFSHIPLIHLMQDIRSRTVQFEESFELFAFTEPGSLAIDEYLHKQMAYIQEVTIQMKIFIQKLSNHVEIQHNAMTNDAFLLNEVQDVKKYHPYLPAELMGMQVSWSELRSISNVKGRISLKIEKLLYVAHCMTQYALSGLLEKFWLRASLYIRGILSVNKNIFTGQLLGYWGMDHAYKQPPIAPLVSAGGEKGGALMTLDEKTGAVMTMNQLRKQQKRDRKAKLRAQRDKDRVTASLSVALSLMDDDIGESSDEEDGDNETDLFSEVDAKHITLETTTETAATDLIKSLMSSAWSRHQGATKQFEVDTDWEKLGAHTHVHVALCLEQEEASCDDFLTVGNFLKFKVRILPQRYPFLEAVHGLCGALGRMLEDLPNLKAHPLIQSAEMNVANKDTMIERLADVEIEDSATPTSLIYFSHLHVNAITAASSGLSHALSFLSLCQQAYNDASGVESQISRLQEIFRKLHSIQPDSLALQLQRSLVLSKLKDMLSVPETSDDVMRAIGRDRGRLSAITSAVEVLEQGCIMSNKFSNLKNMTGFISSFGKVEEQILDICAIKEARLFDKLPTIFITRTSNFTNKLRELCNEFELKEAAPASLEEEKKSDDSGAISGEKEEKDSVNKDKDTNPTSNPPSTSAQAVIQEVNAQMELLRRIQNFEKARDVFDLEVEVCEGLYSVIQTYIHSNRHESNQQRIKDRSLHRSHPSSSSTNPSTHTQQHIGVVGTSRKAQRKALQRQLATGYGQNQLNLSQFRPSAIPINQILETHTQYEAAREKLAHTLSRARSLLLSALMSIKSTILEQRRLMHTHIYTEQLNLQSKEEELAFQEVPEAVSGQGTPYDTPDTTRPSTPTSTPGPVSGKKTLSSTTTSTNPNSNTNSKPTTTTTKGVREDFTSIIAVNRSMGILQDLGNNVSALRMTIDTLIDQQGLLLDAHEVIGSAAPVLLPEEIDYFDDMQALERKYGDKYLSWSSLKQMLLIKRGVIASKLYQIKGKKTQQENAALKRGYCILDTSYRRGTDTTFTPKTLTRARTYSRNCELPQLCLFAS
jgi:hypothetical protein